MWKIRAKIRIILVSYLNISFFKEPFKKATWFKSAFLIVPIPRTIQKLRKNCSLLNASTITDEMQWEINDFCITLARKWNDCCQFYLSKRHRVWLDEGINIRHISTETRSTRNNKDLINRPWLTIGLISRYQVPGELTHADEIHFQIFVPNPYSNVALWNVGTRTCECWFSSRIVSQMSYCERWEVRLRLHCMRIRMNSIPIEFVPTNETFEDQNTHTHRNRWANVRLYFSF